jgi:transposase-like protein
MAPTAQHVIALLERTLTAPDPLHALTSLQELRHELDALERAHAAAALRRGASFADIARPLGITRQAAHRRYRDVLTEAPEPPRTTLTPEARTALLHARQEARRRGSASIDSTHLLLAIATQRGLPVDITRAAPPRPVAAAPATPGLHPHLHARLTRRGGALDVDGLLQAALEDPAGRQLLHQLGIPPQRLLSPEAS